MKADEAARAVAIEIRRILRTIEDDARKSGAKYVQITGSSIINKNTETKRSATFATEPSILHSAWI
jgi:hypothetical protein